MNILKEGTLNKRMVWYTTCDTCGSELRIIQGDPHATEKICYNCDVNQYYIRYICPVCNGMKRAYNSSSAGMKGNARIREEVLTLTDMDEINNWKEHGYGLTDEQLTHINNRMRV